jgi:hypothetical protein
MKYTGGVNVTLPPAARCDGHELLHPHADLLPVALRARPPAGLLTHSRAPLSLTIPSHFPRLYLHAIPWKLPTDGPVG